MWCARVPVLLNHILQFHLGQSIKASDKMTIKLTWKCCTSWAASRVQFSLYKIFKSSVIDHNRSTVLPMTMRENKKREKMRPVTRKIVHQRLIYYYFRLDATEREKRYCKRSKPAGKMQKVNRTHTRSRRKHNGKNVTEIVYPNCVHTTYTRMYAVRLWVSRRRLLRFN